jgi:hypothetical protein
VSHNGLEQLLRRPAILKIDPKVCVLAEGHGPRSPETTVT